MTPKDISDLVIYATRYAIGRHTYASGQVAQLVTKYALVLEAKDKAVLIDDIQKAFKDHAVDEYSTQDWHEALDALSGNGSKRTTNLSQASPKKLREPME